MLQVFNKNYDDYMLCVECCDNIHSIYEFSSRCIKSLNTFLDYKGKLRSCNSGSFGSSIKVEGIEEKAVSCNESIKQEKNTKQGINVMVHTNITEKEIPQSLINVKLEQLALDYDRRQNFVQLESNNDVHVKMEFSQDVQTDPQVKQRNQTTDVFIQENIHGNTQDGTKIRFEDDQKVGCLDYEFIACDDVLNSFEVTEGEISLILEYYLNCLKKCS